MELAARHREEVDRRKRPTRDKFGRLRSAHEIAAWAYARMQEVDERANPGAWTPSEFRNALCTMLIRAIS